MDKLVAMTITIIDAIYSDRGITGLSVNDIYRKTGSRDKPRIIQSIKYLESAEIITTQTDSSHSQKKIKILTTIGTQFAELNKAAKEYFTCYDKFEEKVKSYYSIPPDEFNYSALKSMLRNKGYGDLQILYYRRWRSEIANIESESILGFINSLLAKYAVIIELNPNQDAKTILSKIITNWLDKSLATKGVLSDEIYSDEDEEARLSHLRDIAGKAYLFPRRYKMTFEVEDDDLADRDDRFVKNEVRDLACAMMNVIKPYSKIIPSQFVDDLQGFVGSTELDKVKRRPEIEDKRARENVKNTLEEQLQKEAKSLGFNVTMHGDIKGKTTVHNVSLVVRKQKSCIVIFKHLWYWYPARETTEWIFPAVDIIREPNQKIIFVYSGGTLRPEVLRVLMYYYDAVIPFNKFREYISDYLSDSLSLETILE